MIVDFPRQSDGQGLKIVRAESAITDLKSAMFQRTVRNLIAGWMSEALFGKWEKENALDIRLQISGAGCARGWSAVVVSGDGQSSLTKTMVSGVKPVN